MADWKSRGGGRKAGQSIGSFSGGAGRGGGVPSSHNRNVKGEGGPGKGGGVPSSHNRNVAGVGGAGHGQGRPGSQPSIQPPSSYSEPARGFSFKAAVDFGDTTRAFKTGNSPGSGLDRAGSSIKASSGESSPRVADPEGAFIFVRVVCFAVGLRRIVVRELCAWGDGGRPVIAAALRLAAEVAVVRLCFGHFGLGGLVARHRLARGIGGCRHKHRRAVEGHGHVGTALEGRLGERMQTRRRLGDRHVRMRVDRVR